MRVLIAIHNLETGGAERVAAALAAHWAGTTGVEVALVTLDESPGFFTLPDGVARYALGVSGESHTLLQSFVHNLRRVRALRRTIKRCQAETIVSFMTTTNVLTVLASLGISCRTVLSERTWPPAIPLSKVWSWLRRVSYGRASHLVVATQRTADWVVTEVGVAASDVTVIANPVTWPLPAVEPRLAAPDGAYVLAVGRLGPEKGFDKLLDAFARIRERHPAWRLVIVGDGPLRARLQAASRANDVPLDLPGRVGNLADWYRAAAMLVLTSDFEGFPNVLVEAMSHGCPVVSFDCAVGPREIIRDGIDGFLVAPGDIADLADKTAQLMSDEKLRLRMGRRAEEVRHRFRASDIYAQWSVVAGIGSRP